MKLNYTFNSVGTIFLEGDVALKVVEKKDGGRSCKGCWYNGYVPGTENRLRNYSKSCNAHGHICTAYLRKDNKNVIFKKVQ